MAGSAQRWRVRSSVSCTPGEYFAKRSSMPSLKKKARSWWRSTMPAATGVGPARNLEQDGAVLFEAMALTAELLDSSGAERLAEQRLAIPRRIEAGADVG